MYLTVSLNFKWMIFKIVKSLNFYLHNFFIISSHLGGNF